MIFMMTKTIQEHMKGGIRQWDDYAKTLQFVN